MEVLISDIGNKLDELESQFGLISAERKAELEQLARLIKTHNGSIEFICTHNSRRSQLAEAWIHAISQYYNLNLKAFSGGTEATAFNLRMIKAMREYGFKIDGESADKNPEYFLGNLDQALFSKLYDHPNNPKENYIAVMVCSDAEQNCPYIPGALQRFSLKYKDPKEFDDSPKEHQAYLDKIYEIGREMLYLIKLL